MTSDINILSVTIIIAHGHPEDDSRLHSSSPSLESFEVLLIIFMAGAMANDVRLFAVLI